MDSKENSYLMPYNALHYHIGHSIVLNDIWCWQTNREIGIEIRCQEKECEGSEPLLEVDIPNI